MPRIILMNTFIKHYVGSVFDLSDVIGISGWDDDERARERLNLSDKRSYQLPDAGNGRAAELPISYTTICPGDVFTNVDLTAGPCRITAVTKDLEDSSLDRLSAPVLPHGLGKVRLDEIADRTKNLVTILLDTPIESADVFTQPDGSTARKTPVDTASKMLDFSTFTPGFYRVVLNCTDNWHPSFTMIKCFPVVVNYDARTRRYSTPTTIWQIPERCHVSRQRLVAR